MAGAFVSIELKGEEQLTQAFNRLISQSSDVSPAFRDIGEYLIESTQKRFQTQQSPSGESWQSLSAKTIKNKKRKDKILTESGTLADTLHYLLSGHHLEFGSNMEYAATHQFGREDGNIPAREFLGVSAEDENEILHIIRAHLIN